MRVKEQMLFYWVQSVDLNGQILTIDQRTRIIKLHKSLNLFANIRPTTVVKGASSLSPLKEERVEGTDLVIVRELTSGIYFGRT